MAAILEEAPIAVRYLGGSVAREVPYWSWGNPAVREVTRNVAGIAGTTGAVAGVGTLLAGIFGKRRMDIDSAYKRRYPESRVEVDRITRRRIDFMDQLSVAAGNRTTTNRYVNKVKLRAGRIGRKLQKESEEFIQRWQRIYNFGNNSMSYPSNTTEQVNPGITVATWVTGFNATNTNTGRLMLSHCAPIDDRVGWQMMPGYLFDITCWRNTSNTYQPLPMQRIAFDANGNMRLIPCAQQQDVSSSANSFLSTGTSWAGESGPSGTALPTSTEQKALLSWSDIRLALYGAKKRCSKIHIEFVQFQDQKYLANFHPDGELVENMSQLDRNDVNLFWLNEFKRLTFNPLVVNTFIRKKALKVMRSENFCVNADDSTNEDPGPPVVHKQYFKRFNRLVNWNWNSPNTTMPGGWTSDKAGPMEDPDYQVTDQGSLLGYANPNARVYMYIRAEDFEPVAGSTALSVIPETRFTTNFRGNIDPAPPGGETFNASFVPTARLAANLATETAGDPFVSNIVSEYVPVYRPGDNSAAYMPVYNVANAQYASDNHVSFDIIVRNKWRIQT